MLSCTVNLRESCQIFTNLFVEWLTVVKLSNLVVKWRVTSHFYHLNFPSFGAREIMAIMYIIYKKNSSQFSFHLPPPEISMQSLFLAHIRYVIDVELFTIFCSLIIVIIDKDKENRISSIRPGLSEPNLNNWLFSTAHQIYNSVNNWLLNDVSVLDIFD